MLASHRYPRPEWGLVAILAIVASLVVILAAPMNANSPSRRRAKGRVNVSTASTTTGGGGGAGGMP